MQTSTFSGPINQLVWFDPRGSDSLLAVCVGRSAVSPASVSVSVTVSSSYCIQQLLYPAATVSSSYCIQQLLYPAACDVIVTLSSSADAEGDAVQHGQL